jgi:hypothetical protein
MARYQQGIGTPETLGVQSTYWKDPILPKTTPINYPTVNVGVGNNYGSLSDNYVDTMPSRWTVNPHEVFQWSRKTKQEPSSLTPSTPTGTIPPSTPTGTIPPRQPSIMSIVSAARSRTQRRGASGATPTEPVDDFLQNIRSASDEPFTPPRAQFVDEPQNPFPRGSVRDLTEFMAPPSTSRTANRSRNSSLI